MNCNPTIKNNEYKGYSSTQYLNYRKHKDTFNLHDKIIFPKISLKTFGDLKFPRSSTDYFYATIKLTISISFKNTLMIDDDDDDENDDNDN